MEICGFQKIRGLPPASIPVWKQTRARIHLHRMPYWSELKEYVQYAHLQLFLLVSKLRSTLGADGGLLAALCHGSLNSCLASLDDGIACLMADRGTAVRIYAGPRRYSKITSSKMYSITSSNITSSEITAVKITTVRILGDRKETPRRCPKRAVCMQSNRFQNEPLCLSPYASWHRVIES